MGNMKGRIKEEIRRLSTKNYEIVKLSDNLNEIEILFNGPPETPFHGGKFKVRILIPDEYPFKSPSVGFVTKIFHPNIDEKWKYLFRCFKPSLVPTFRLSKRC